MISRKTKVLSVVAAGMAAFPFVPAHADEISDLKAMVKELKAQVVEERSQVKELRAQVNDLSSQMSDQKAQVGAQGAAVQRQSGALQKVEAQQQVIERKQAETAVPAPAPAPAEAAKPGYFAIPGTKTALKIGGYVKLDMVDDVSANIGTGAFNKTASDFADIPLNHSQAANRSGQLNFSAQESRLNISSLTTSDSLGDVQSTLEGDFYQTAGGDHFLRLRHAYVSGGSFGAGQTWSTFSDLYSAGPETLDFNGPVGIAGVRQPQLRYTAKLPTGDLAFALESPTGDISVSGSDDHIDKAPDLVARYTADPSWGHFAVAGLGRYLDNNSGLPGPGQRSDTVVYGVMGGVMVKTVGKDMLMFQTVDGNGIGRYLIQGQGTNAGQGISAIRLPNGKIKPINMWTGTIGYTHFWADALRSNVAYGYGHFGTPAGETSVYTGAGTYMRPLRDMSSVHVNLIMSPWEATDVGVEYIYGQVGMSRPVLDPATGTSAKEGSASRVEASVKHAF